MNIISGSSNPQLVESLVAKLRVTDPQASIIDCQIEKFSNDEKKVWIKDENKVRGQKVCLLQSFSKPVDENIIETLLLIDALERLGAKEVSLIIPWMGYSLQDKVFREGEAIAAKVIADLISNSFVSRVFLIDLHNPSIPGFFSIPTYHLSAKDLFVEYLKTNNLLQNASVISPDFGGLKRARTFANLLDLPLLNIDKSRDYQTGVVTAHALHGGEISGRNAIVFDDVIVSGGTVAEVASLLKKEGANKVIFIATHGIFCKNGINVVNNSEVDLVITSDSIAHNEKSAKIIQVPLASLFATSLTDWI
jgi:ribose-phosphate pyrophosphokinase